LEEITEPSGLDPKFMISGVIYIIVGFVVWLVGKNFLDRSYPYATKISMTTKDFYKFAEKGFYKSGETN
jgi:hypothetical protein